MFKHFATFVLTALAPITLFQSSTTTSNALNLVRQSPQLSAELAQVRNEMWDIVPAFAQIDTALQATMS